MSNWTQVEVAPGMTWTVQDEPARPPAPVQPPPAPETGPTTTPETGRKALPWPLLTTLSFLAVWCAGAALLFLIGALTPIKGNLLTYIVMIAGLFGIVLMLLTCPRPAEDRDTGYWTWGNEATAYGQCTPSRHTLTGRQ